MKTLYLEGIGAMIPGFRTTLVAWTWTTDVLVHDPAVPKPGEAARQEAYIASRTAE
jgi:hypothetical protein